MIKSRSNAAVHHGTKLDAIKRNNDGHHWYDSSNGSNNNSLAIRHRSLSNNHKYRKRKMQRRPRLRLSGSQLWLTTQHVLWILGCCLVMVLMVGILLLLLMKEWTTNYLSSFSPLSYYRNDGEDASQFYERLGHRVHRLRQRSKDEENLQQQQQNEHAGLFSALNHLEQSMIQNWPSYHRIPPELLVSLTPNQPNPLLMKPFSKSHTPKFSMHGQFFRVSRTSPTASKMKWTEEWQQLLLSSSSSSQQQLQHNNPHYVFDPIIDYTQQDHHRYDYADKRTQPPASGYPTLRPLSELLEEWPQNEIDHPPIPIQERLQHFDFTTELDIAILYRRRKLPFKLYNVPELIQANLKWTDDYISQQFDGNPNEKKSTSTTVQGKCQESLHHFFAFFQPNAWNVEQMGNIPPTRNNDWTFHQWSQHAKYADAIQLDSTRPHFYWQAGVPKEERELPNPSSWSFVSKDLPSFSSPNATFVCPDPKEQKGIQCRFGERGVTTATHYDAGQNMIGMITGAKRYILHPPKECSKLGIVTSRNSALFRHSLLNFGHYNDMDDDVDSTKVSELEKQWLERAGKSMAVETVLKAGEILFVPSHWFHYIIGLQKNAQCNVRSGVDLEGDTEFGNAYHISEQGCDPTT